MTPSKGVRIEDMGVKFGCNGVDNGKLFFEKVRVPAENILNKYSDISKDGKFSSVINDRRGYVRKRRGEKRPGCFCYYVIVIVKGRPCIDATIFHACIT